MHLRILPDHQNLFFKKIFLTIWSGKKRVLMHLHIPPDHQKFFFEKDIFDHLEWLKACFDAFPHTSRPPETLFQKRYFLLSGAITNVFFLRLRILPDNQKLFFKKDIFDRLEWLKNVFGAFSHTCRSPETFFKKRYFLPSGVVKNVF